MIAFRILAVGLAAIGGFALTSPASAQDEALWPTSQWGLTEFEDKCRLARTYGQGEDAVTLWIEQGSARPAYNLTLIGRPFRHPYGSKVSVQFAPEPAYERAYLTATSSGGRPVLALFGARLTPTRAELDNAGDAADWRGRSDEGETVDLVNASSADIGDTGYLSEQRVDAITQLRLDGALVDPVVLQTGPLAQPLGRLTECARRLDERISQTRAGSPAVPVEQARWARVIQMNYPRQMLREEEEASIAVVLTIGKDGKPSFCEVTDVVGPTSFNDTVCLLMLRHAMFEPARDEKGKPVVSRYKTSVTFVIN